jgi:hypothetical protein
MLNYEVDPAILQPVSAPQRLARAARAPMTS